MSNPCQAQKQIENDLSGAAANPTLSTMDILSSLKQVNYFRERLQDDAFRNGELGNTASQELQFLAQGMAAIRNPVLSSKPGRGFSTKL